MTARFVIGLRRQARRTAVRDAALAVCVLVAVVLLSPTQTRSSVLWLLIMGVVAVATALRNRWPAAMLAVCALAVVPLAGTGPITVISGNGVLIGLYTVAARRSRPVSLAALCGLLAVLFGWSGYFALQSAPAPGVPVLTFHTARAGPGPDPAVAPVKDAATGSALSNGVLLLGSALLAGWAIGSATRSRRAYLDELRERAQDLERERDQRAALAVAAERARISRELHDVVAHGLSLIVIQAQGGAAALDDYPAETRTALDTIVRAGRESLVDTRRVLKALDSVEDAWHPQPGLAQLPALLREVEQAGIGVKLRVDGQAGSLPAPVDLSAYRIVQEALTNVMKHAGAGSSAEVCLSYSEAAVEVEVWDDGPAGHRAASTGRGTDATGNGLRGMQERVRLLGGGFTAGPRADGGFRIHATLPIQSVGT